jgi:hypothetical protein
MPPEERERTLERRRRMLDSMDDEARRHMKQQFDRMRQRPAAPEAGSPAPDFDLMVLDGGGKRVRLKDLLGKPVGLIFGSYT